MEDKEQFDLGDLMINRKPEYRLVKIDTHPHPDFHYYAICEIFRDKNNNIKVISEPITIKENCTLDLLMLLDDLVTVLDENKGTLNLSDYNKP